MQNTKTFGNIKDFVRKAIQDEKMVTFYKRNPNPTKIFKNFNIKVELDECKEIILQEETRVELGGVNKKSFLIIYPLNELSFIDHNKITLIGPEINQRTGPNLDFGMFILIGCARLTEKEFNSLRRFSFISDGIEGFLIRSIPRRFWCRINAEVMKKGFSFELLGNAIMYLYQKKFKNLIDSMEIFFII